MLCKSRSKGPAGQFKRLLPFSPLLACLDITTFPSFPSLPCSPQLVKVLAPSVQGHSCAELHVRAPAIVHNMGYQARGIVKGSMGAQGMSLEARASGGGVPKMTQGGISSSLQSIGASGGEGRTHVEGEGEESAPLLSFSRPKHLADMRPFPPLPLTPPPPPPPRRPPPTPPPCRLPCCQARCGALPHKCPGAGRREAAGEATGLGSTCHSIPTACSTAALTGLRITDRGLVLSAVLDVSHAQGKPKLSSE